MPVSAGTVQFSYTGDGTTTVFAFPSRFLSNADIIVGVNGVPVLSGFVVTGQGNETGGNVTFAVAPLNGQTVTLIRAPSISQLLDFVNNQTVLAENIDNGLDKLTIIAQYLNYLIERTIRLSQFDTGLTGNYDAQGKRIGNVAAPVNSADVARLIDIQGIVAAAGSVPLPTGGQIGYVLQAIGAGVFGWTAQGSVQPLNANLTAESGLTGAADKVSYYTGAGAKALANFTSLGRGLVSMTATTTLTAGTNAQGQGQIGARDRLAFVAAVAVLSGVTLPSTTTGEAGRDLLVVNPAASTASINVYPSAGQGYNNAAIDVPITVPPGHSLYVMQRFTTQWAYFLLPYQTIRRQLAGGFALSDTETPSLSWVDGFVDLRSLGRSQTWQDLVGSRALGTSYQNLTGRPITFSPRITQAGATNVVMETSPDNTTWTVVSRYQHNVGSTFTDYTIGSVVVPPTFYYRTRAISGGNTLTAWLELR